MSTTTGTVGTPNGGSAPAKKRVFLVEDHPVFRTGLKHLIDNEPDMQVAGEVESAPQAVSRLREHRVDAAIVDISLEGTDGIELVKHVRAEHETLPLLVLSMHDESVYAMRAIRAGANGYLMKREDPETILAGLRSILAGEMAVSPKFKEHLVSRVLRGGTMAEPNPIDSLTDRELEVLNLVGLGMSSRQIAEKLHLSMKTIESHRLHVKEKLNLQNAGEMVRFAVEWVNRPRESA
jgi:DNA-binding NarL/FixJ family response regulator